MNRSLGIIFAFIFSLFAPPVWAKPFKRALVLTGGGITPGVALGIIEGARSQGYEPDVIIVTCGSSLGAAIHRSFDDVQKGIRYSKSSTFYDALKWRMRLGAWTPLGIRSKFENLVQNPTRLPDVFDGILKVREDVSGMLPNDKFPARGPRLIVVASEALFGMQDVGKDMGQNPLFRETYFTDPETARYLDGRVSAVKNIFPYSRIAHATEVRSDVSLSQAVRATITDPFYVNPAKIGERYYFGGAIDLFPFETALDIADEVLATFPSGRYATYDDLAIESTFGFAQSDRAAAAARHTQIKWIDPYGTADLAMDPKLNGWFFTKGIPDNSQEFSILVAKQFRFGFQRGAEAVRVQKSQPNIRSHLRYTHAGR